MVSFAEGIQSCVAQEEVVMAETGAEALARMIVAKGRILLVPSTKSFLYQGFSDKQHVVTLLPTETCSCSASDSAQRCVHRLAAVLAIGGMLLQYTLVYCSLGQGGDLSLPASLSVSPDRSQFFEFESVSLSCEVQGNSTGWRVVRNAERGNLSECNTDWGKQQGSSCIVSLIPSYSGVYRCESGSGEHSNAVNITVPAGGVILESPALPVTEGDSVTLRCRYQGTPSDITAVFYKDGSLIRAESSGEMTIPAVSKSDEGLYKCSNSKGESPESWMTVMTAGAVILESPALPVTEGDSVTLRCRYQGTPSNLTADFYKDGSLIRTETTGEMTIPAVSKSDEGLYKCTNSEGESPESWMTVMTGAGPSPIPSPAAPVLSMSLPRLLCSLLVGSPYLLVGSPYL
ncbi:high affinity immunoglobulin gamma Fc receptor I-like [Salmo trutta]|uniref:high affinity immunoglobulin gamma Fc receptor I-like n=1 Tax=Salmo trutta TaxID=8032 RepID=UPI001130655D|nr:high affinity immunoglobulin gamma Fc receptor I-like [Salmo trutta]